MEEFLDRYSYATRKVNSYVLAEAGSYMKVDLGKANHSHVLNYVKSISNQSPNTRKRKISTLSAYFRYLVDRDVMKKNPMLIIRKPKVDRIKTIRWLSREDADALIENASGPMERAILAAGLSGLRLTEIAGLDAGQFRDGRLWNVEGKGGKIRTVPLTNEADRCIDMHLNGRTKGPMFSVTKAGDRISPRTIQNVVYRESEATLGSRINVHMLRHTHATLLAKADVPVLKIGRILGHANPTVTEIYVHLDDEDLRDTVRVLDKPIGKPKLRLVKEKTA